MQFIRAFIIPLIIILIMVDMVFFRFLLKSSRGVGMSVYFWIVVIALEYYSFHALRTVTKNTWVLWAYILLHVAVYGSMLYFSMNERRGFSSPNFKKLIILITLFIIPKIFLALSLIVDDIVRIVTYGFKSVSGDDAIEIPSRRRAAAWIGLGIAAIPFMAVLDGIFFGKYRYRVIRKQVYFHDLPEEFDGFTLTQLSDIHSGSFDDAAKVDYGVKMAAAQNSDILVFTGDMVNNEAVELEPYKEIFMKLEAASGMFAVLGNHDYGDYGNLSEAEKKQSVRHLQQMQREIGFEPLNNAMRTIERNGKRLNVIGVENWGHSHFFPKRGDLNKATAGVRDGDFNILLSHDPSHFDHDLPEYDNVINYKKKLHLTLSGHTHGMQFGIEIPGVVKWSPVKYRYKNWGGLYENNGRQLYVNRGFGYLAFPGRVGMWPEITVLELKRKV